MNIFKRTMAALLALAGLLTVHSVAMAQGSASVSSAASAPSAAASAASAAAPADVVGMGTQYSEKGADTCLGCHDEEADTLTFTTAGIFKNRHAQRGNAHAPFGPGGLQCEACHGPGAKHSSKGSKKKLT